MACCSITCFAWLIVICVIYKVINRLVRRLRIADIGERFILVTGCDSGFGNLLVKRLDRLGCHVFAGCLTEKGEDNIKKSSNQVYPIRLDVTKPEDIRKALEFVKSKLPSGKGLWGVVNNAGIPGKVGPIDWLRVEDFKDTINVNTLGIVDVTMTFLPLIKKARGRVVITTSVCGFMVFPNLYSYGVSKFGAEAFGDGLRRSLLSYGCKAILIEPGMYDTDMASCDAFNQALTACWNNASPEVKEEYGEGYLEKAMDSIQETQKMKSSRVSDVVDAYEEALLGRYPRARYLVGLDAQFLFKPLHLLPECISDWLFEVLSGGLPIPAALRRN